MKQDQQQLESCSLSKCELKILTNPFVPALPGLPVVAVAVALNTSAELVEDNSVVSGYMSHFLHFRTRFRAVC
jgi:hypothetical protein